MRGLPQCSEYGRFAECRPMRRRWLSADQKRTRTDCPLCEYAKGRNPNGAPRAPFFNYRQLRIPDDA